MAVGRVRIGIGLLKHAGLNNMTRRRSLSMCGYADPARDLIWVVNNERSGRNTSSG
jgi:hypothetical protein